MKPAPFDYIRPTTMAEALVALRENEDATVISGGQSLLPMLNLRVTAAEMLIDISGLKDLGTVSENDGIFSIGALVTHARIEDGLGREAFRGLLHQVASKIAYRAVRNVGTVGGSLSLCDPSADWPACLLALGAKVNLVSAEGERQLPLDEFLVDAYTTALEPGELLTRIDMPRQDECRWGVSKVTRKSGAFADSLAIAVLGHGDLPACVTLTGTSSRAQILSRTSGLLAEGETNLAEAISEDVAAAHEDATPYQIRCHIHTVTTAISEANAWSK